MDTTHLSLNIADLAVLTFIQIPAPVMRSFSLTNSLFFMVFLVLMASCKHSKQTIGNQYKKLPQGIEGTVIEKTGNHMPSPTFKSTSASDKGIATMVYVVAKCGINNVWPNNASGFYSKINAPIIDSVLSDNNGRFSVKLPVGAYSLFVKWNGGFYANRFDEQNNINVYQVTSQYFTPAEIVVSGNATF